MSYTSRHRYKNRREKFRVVSKKTLITITIVSIFLIFLAIRNWQTIKDWYYATFG